jgi:predicted O-methyltransferase YrrM
MNKVSKFFKAFVLILKQPSLLNKVLDDPEVNKRTVVKKYNLPLGLKTVDIAELIPQFDIRVMPFAALDGGSTPIDLALLKGLAASVPDCSYFEIGTWRGESVANIATLANNCTTLNLPDETMRSMGLDSKYIDMHRFFSKNLQNVTHLQGNSKTFDFSGLHEKFDLIFIDGDHHYESVKKDTENAFKLLKDENSIIVWHDYGHTPDDIRWDVLRGILDGTPTDKINRIYRVSNTLCAIFTNKKLTAENLPSNTPPKKYFSLDLKISKI